MIFGELGMENVLFVIEDSVVITIPHISVLFFLQSPDANSLNIFPPVVSGL
jgi:hypothetical protein